MQARAGSFRKVRKEPEHRSESRHRTGAVIGSPAPRGSDSCDRNRCSKYLSFSFRARISALQHRAKNLLCILPGGGTEDFLRRSAVHSPDKAVTAGITFRQKWPIKYARSLLVDLFGFQLAHILRLAGLDRRRDTLIGCVAAEESENAPQFFQWSPLELFITDDKKRQFRLIEPRRDVLLPASCPRIHHPAAGQPLLDKALEERCILRRRRIKEPVFAGQMLEVPDRHHDVAWIAKQIDGAACTLPQRYLGGEGKVNLYIAQHIALLGDPCQAFVQVEDIITINQPSVLRTIEQNVKQHKVQIGDAGLREGGYVRYVFRALHIGIPGRAR